MSDNGSVGPTPGPWRVGDGGIVEMGAVGSSLSFWAGLGYGGQLPNPSGQEPRAELAANARLIAAVWDLAEALTEARAALHQHYIDWDGEPEDAVPLQLARAKCDAALQKAGLSAGEGC